MCVSSSHGRGLLGQFFAVCSILRCLKENSYEKLVMQVPGWKKVMGLPRDEEEEERGEERRMRNLGKPELLTEGQKTKRRGRTFRRSTRGTKRRK